jgi:hypothetical protein
MTSVVGAPFFLLKIGGKGIVISMRNSGREDISHVGPHSCANAFYERASSLGSWKGYSLRPKRAALAVPLRKVSFGAGSLD